MKTIGILGGMSWESTAHYYALINEEVRERLGGLHSAPILLRSVEFAEIRELQLRNDWEASARLLGGYARGLAEAGADFLLIATNTMHIVADAVEAAAGIPLLHIADPTGEAVAGAGIGRIGLLGTGFTMRCDFYKSRLQKNFDLKTVVPSEADMDLVDRIIFDELCRGVVRERSQREYLRILEDLSQRGAEGAILGCTEIGMLIGPEQTSLPLFDTTALHARAAVTRSLTA